MILTISKMNAKVAKSARDAEKKMGLDSSPNPVSFASLALSVPSAFIFFVAIAS